MSLGVGAGDDAVPLGVGVGVSDGDTEAGGVGEGVADPVGVTDGDGLDEAELPDGLAEGYDFDLVAEADELALGANILGTGPGYSLGLTFVVDGPDEGWLLCAADN
jgi:hypothetical protein